MERITTSTYFNQSIANIQNSYDKLVKLQNQVQTQQIMEHPSDDPVRANQAIMLDSSLNEIKQYLANTQSGSDLLTYSDQMLDNLMAPLNTAIEKAAQGLNAEQDPTSRSAIAAELNSILDTFISIGNTNLNNKNIFGGSQTTGDVFTRLGSDILFNGNNNAYNVEVTHGESIQANLLAKDIFGASSTILDSERNLNPRLADMSLESGIPVHKLVDTNVMIVDGRNAALLAFSKADPALYGTASGPYGLLKTSLGTLTSTNFTSMSVYLDKIRDITSVALGATNTTLTAAQSVVVKQVLDAAQKVFAANSTSLVLQADRNIAASKLTVTMNATNSGSAAAVVSAVNAAKLKLAGVNGSGNVDHNNTKINARLEVLNAFQKTASQLGVADPGLATQIDLITVNGTTTSKTYAKAVQDAAVTAFGVANYASLDANQKIMTDAAVQAGKNAFSATEFSAISTRSGLSITHSTSDLIMVDEASSDETVVHTLELGQSNNSSLYSFKTGDITTLAVADRMLTLTNASGSFIEVQLRKGDTAEVVARRINRAVNQLDIPTDIRKIVAEVDKTSGNDRLVLSGGDLFKVSMDNNTEIANGKADLYAALNGTYQSIEDLRSGSGITTGTQKLTASDLVTKFDSTITVMAGDSLEYLLKQLNNLSGFDASLNVGSDGLKLTNMARYALDSLDKGLTVAAGTTISITKSNGLSQAILLASTTLSQQAEEINAKSTSFFPFHAEVNSTGTGLVISSSQNITVGDGVTTATTSDLSTQSLITSNILTSLGLSLTSDADGVIQGQSLLNRQVRLSELNNGLGISKGSFRISIGNTKVDVDLNKAATLRDVKTMIEAALPGLVKVDLNNLANGLAIKSLSSNPVTLEELYGGSTARTLGLIKAPATSASGTDIQGLDIDPQFSGVTLLKDLNGGRGLDSTGFTIKNGDHQTTITLDSNGDGVDDIHTLEALVNHINQVAKQDQVYITASIDPKKGGLKIASQLANTSLEVKETTARNSTFRVAGVPIGTLNTTLPAVAADTLTIQSADRTKTITVAVTAGDTAATIANNINIEAAKTTTSFGFKAMVNESGTVDILSNQAILVSNTTASYTTTAYSPNPPVYGTSASDLGLLGAFSNSSLLSTLNNGTGIEKGTFILKYGSVNTPSYTLDITSTSTDSVTFYNENASQSYTVASIVALSAADKTALATLGITATASGTLTNFSSSKFFTVQNNTTNSALPVKSSVNALTTTAKSVTVDVEFATTLGDVKKAIETASNGEVLVDFDRSNRLQLRLASGDDTQRIEIQETGGSLSVAHSLGLMNTSVIYGRELRDGTNDLLSSSTLLSNLGLNINTTALAHSGENNLVLLSGSGTDADSTTLNFTTARTVGDVISIINAARVSDSGKAVQFEASIVNGRYLTITNKNSGPVSALNTSFSQAAERLGLIPDPQLTGESTFVGADLNPSHQAENFFSILTTLRDQFAKSDMNQPIVSNMLIMLNSMQEKLLSARGEAGGRINRFDLINTRYTEESTFVEGLYGDKTGVDVISTTQKYLAQQQAYEAGLSVASKILGTSLFTYL